MEDRGPFSRTTIDDIARCSGGHPGRIDAMTDALLKRDRKGSHWRRTSDGLWRLMRELSGSGGTIHH